MPIRILKRTETRRASMKQDKFQEVINRTATFIAEHQLPSGAIPYYQEGITDPWDHVECAIALDLSGRSEEAARAYQWLREMQNPDGSWWYTYRDNQPQELAKDSNHSSYIATGVWQHYLTTKDMNFLQQMWPMVESGMDFALGLQQPGGEIFWCCDAEGTVWISSILSASSCIYQSIKDGLKIAGALGLDRPEWKKAGQRLARAIREKPERFDAAGENEREYAMNWYYPVLAGVVRGQKAREHIHARWAEFVVDGWGCLCSLDQSWVTIAETCELILALIRLGERKAARTLLDWVLPLRDSDGGYWTGIAIPEEVVYPPYEKTTWTSAAVIIALVASLGNQEVGVIERQGF
jgi:hypothetical protein